MLSEEIAFSYLKIKINLKKVGQLYKIGLNVL